MYSTTFSRFLSFFISLSLLVAPLPMTAIAQERILSEPETAMIVENSHDPYVYLGSELSDIALIVEKIAHLDHDKDSLLHALKKHIDNGFFLARYDAVIQALEYAALIIERNCTKTDNADHNSLMNDFELLVNQVTGGLLHVDAEVLQTAHNGNYNSLEILRGHNLRLLVVNEDMEVLGKTTLRKHLNTKQGIHCQGHLKVNKSAKFKKDVTVKGFFSAKDAFIGNLSIGSVSSISCIDTLCANDFSAKDAIAENLTVGNLEVEGCMDSLCVENFSAVDASINGTLSVNTIVVLASAIQDLTITGTLSSQDAIIQNTTITNLSSTDTNIQNLTVANCMTNLCVNSLSVVDMAISGTLSINDIIIDDATVLDFSATDANVQNLSATDTNIQNLTVANCMTNLCVSSLSVVDMAISGTLSINDIIIDDATVLDFSATDANIQNLSAIDTSIQNLTVANCMTNLCVNSLSVVEMSASGTLSVNDEIIKTFLRFNDATSGEYVGINAPSIVPISYTISLPSTSPTANQVLRANAIVPTNLEWVTEGGSIAPSTSNTIYVTKYGNDTTGNGSFDLPYATLSKAISVANVLASSVNPITISISSGIYVENNSTGPLTITTDGISLAGDSSSSVIIMPNTPTNDLLLITDTIHIADITLQSPAPLATGISLIAGNLSVLNNVRILNFLIGVSCAGGLGNSYEFIECLFVNNTTALVDNNTFVQCNNITIFGISTLTGPATNTGIVITGASARLVLSGGICGVCETAVDISNNANLTISEVGFRGNAFDIVQTGPSNLVVSGCTFELTNDTSDIDIQVSGSGAVTEIISCEFNGKDLVGTTEGVGISISDNASVNINGSNFHNYTTAIQIGLPTDTASTSLSASAVSIRDCSFDIIQQGSASLSFNAGTASSSKVSVNDPTNVTLAFFDLDTNSALTIGSLADQNTTLIQAAINPTNNPVINYESSLYSTQAIGFDNSLLTNPTSWFTLSNDDAHLTGITTDRTKIAGLRLVSDEGSPIGGTSALRGWDINKNSSNAELSFNYQNTDIIGQIAIAPYTVMQLDGFNNQLQLPTTSTQIVFAGDTNLYRDSADVLKTDDNFIVATLTPDRVVVTDPVTNQLASSVVTGTELSYLSGVTSSLQTQIDSKVAKAGDIMTGTLELPAGTTASPSLVFTGSTTTGLSAPVADRLSFSTAALERMAISSSGIVSINAFTTTGVVHNDASGNLSSSLIINADITNATISNSKLATISSNNTAGAIVVRDVSGNFATNMISLAGAVSNPTDAATKAYVDAAIALGLVAKTPALVVSTTDVLLTGLQIIDGVLLAPNDRVLLVGQTNPIENGLWLAQVGAWTRPADFASGSTVGQAYVLITSGMTYTGSSWLSDTPTAVVDTDPISFVLFTLPDTTTGANVGAGTGLVFRNKTGITLNFRTLLADTHMSIISNADDITIGTDATSANTPSTIVSRDASGNFSAGTITANLTGSASNNVLKAGDTMTGVLQLPAGTTLAPALIFTGSTISGLSASAGDLSFSTNALERLKIANSGTISINAFTSAGVVHNDASGNLSSSLIVNADVDPAAAIVDTKLATISTAGKVANSATTATSLNTANTIVARDASGNFSAGTIIASLNGAASLNVLKAGDTMTGTLQLPAGTTALPSLVFTGSTTTGLSASAGDLSFSTSGLERMKISSGGTISIDAFTAAGVVHNDASGNLSSSLIVNADVDPAAAIVDTKLATISTAGKVANSATTATSLNTANAIVTRDASGNFDTNMITIAGTVTNPTDVATKAYADSLVGTGGTNLNTANTLVRRDSTGSFAAQVISMVDSVASGNLILSTEPSTSTAGNIIKGTSRFIHDFGTNNVFVGLNAGNFTMSGSGNNSGFGFNALIANTTGAFNTAVGSSTLAANTIGTRNTALGSNALLVNTTGTDNTAVGFNALTANATGTSNNTAVGSSALAANTTGTRNTAVGRNTLAANTTGFDNTALGYNALAVNATGTSGNTAVGSSALAANTTGTRNVAVGRSALLSNIQCTDNTAIGYNALASSGAAAAGTSANNNTAVGSTALAANTSGNQNTSVGASALTSNTIGVNNVAIGYLALNANTITSFNVAVGAGALQVNTTGSNTAVGFQALTLNTTGTSNTAIGSQALAANVTGTNNTAVGLSALNVFKGTNSVAVGTNALISATTGTNNIAIGTSSGGVLTIGSDNIYINANAATAAEATTTRIGTSQTRCFIAGISGATTGVADAVAVLIDSAGQLGTISSSKRYKQNIQKMGTDSHNILELNPVTFTYIQDETDTKQFGLIAEEVQEIFPDIVVRNEEGQPETVQYHVLPVLLLNEVKKQQALINAQQEAMKEQENAIETLVITVTAMNNAINELQSQVKSFMSRSHNA